VVDVLVDKAILALRQKGAAALVLGGGVACNQRLRERMKARAIEEGALLYTPRPEYCTDNGAMIAVAGYHRLQSGHCAGLDLDVRSRFPL